MSKFASVYIKPNSFHKCVCLHKAQLLPAEPERMLNVRHGQPSTAPVKRFHESSGINNTFSNDTARPACYKKN